MALTHTARKKRPTAPEHSANPFHSAEFRKQLNHQWFFFTCFPGKSQYPSQPMAKTPAPEREQVISFPTPQLLDRHLLERVSAKIARSKVLQPGSPHPNARDFSGFVLLKTLPPSPTEPDWYLRIWTNGRANQNTYNAEVSYAEESVDHPIFLREYLEARPHIPLAKGAALAGLTGAKPTAGGTGFDQDTAVIVLTGGTGSGGVIKPIVENGAITGLIVITPGTYSVVPTLSATGGTGFAGTAYVQPQTAVLVKEETGRLTDEMDALYVKVRRVYETLPGPVLAGQEYDRRTGLIIAYTEQVRATADVPAAKTEVTPIDTVKRTHRTVTEPTAAINALVVKGFSYESFSLPDVLTGVTITYNTSSGEGSHSQAGDGISAGTAASLTLHLSSRAQSSASVMADAQPIIRKYDTSNVPTNHYFFYMPDSFTLATLLARLDDADLANATVLAWPSFKEESVVLTLKGQQVSVAANADVQQHGSFNASNITLTYGIGSGNSKETGVSIKTVLIPPTIHAAITYTGATSSAAAIEAEASATIESGNNVSIWPARTATAPTTGATATASVFPTSIPATAGLTAIPVTGLYLRSVDFSPISEWDGFAFVHAKVVDFSFFAP